MADDLLDGVAPPAGLLLDQGFRSRLWAAAQQERGTAIVYAHSQAEGCPLPTTARRLVARLRNRIETTIGELTDPDRLRLARHGARTVWGLLMRIAATILAYTLLGLELV